MSATIVPGLTPSASILMALGGFVTSFVEARKARDEMEFARQMQLSQLELQKRQMALQEKRMELAESQHYLTVQQMKRELAEKKLDRADRLREKAEAEAAALREHERQLEYLRTQNQLVTDRQVAVENLRFENQVKLREMDNAPATELSGLVAGIPEKYHDLVMKEASAAYNSAMKTIQENVAKSAEAGGLIKPFDENQRAAVIGAAMDRIAYALSAAGAPRDVVLQVGANVENMGEDLGRFGSFRAVMQYDDRIGSLMEDGLSRAESEFVFTFNHEPDPTKRVEVWNNMDPELRTKLAGYLEPSLVGEDNAPVPGITTPLPSYGLPPAQPPAPADEGGEPFMKDVGHGIRAIPGALFRGLESGIRGMGPIAGATERQLRYFTEGVTGAEIPPGLYESAFSPESPDSTAADVLRRRATVDSTAVPRTDEQKRTREADEKRKDEEKKAQRTYRGSTTGQ